MKANTTQKNKKINHRIQAKKYEPSDIEIERIKQSGVDPEGYGFYEFRAAESLIDRDGDVLTKGFLESMAALYREGRAVLDSHNPNYRIGKVYDAVVQTHSDATGEYELVARLYVPPFAKTISGNSAKDEIDSGIVERVSVSFFGKSSYVSSNAEGNELGVDHFRFDAQDLSDRNQFDVIELSLVAMGAQSGARRKGEGEGGGCGADIGSAGANSPQNGGIGSGHTLPKIQANDTMKYLVKSIEKEIEVNPDSLEIVQELETKLQEANTTISEANDRLKVFEDREAEAKKGLIEIALKARKAIADQNQIAFDADATKTKLQAKTYDQLVDEVELLKGATKVIQLNPGQEREELTTPQGLNHRY